LFFVAGCSSKPPVVPPARLSCCAFVELTNFSSFTRQGQGAESETLLSPIIVAPIPFTELILSWNVDLPEESGLRVEAQVISGSHRTRFYNLGSWSQESAACPRQSMRNQRDADGDVRTDTLVLRQPASTLQLRLTLFPDKAGAFPPLKLLGFSFAGAERTNCLASVAPGSAWGRELPVTELSQLSYPDGREWCSPTCVSMVLNYWAQTLRREDLKVEVPTVAHAIHDPNWPGTGNWPFNTAYAGQFAGMKAYVRRFNDLAEIEPWIKARVPIILSISSDALHGRALDRNNGHLVVCAGFTSDGNVVICNPWADLAAGQQVRRIYDRARVVRAWASSRNTAYVIHPEPTSLRN
jgi:uncharacterized protein YvpB